MAEFFLFFVGILIGVSLAFSNVTEDQWTQGQDLCSPNGGLSEFTANPSGRPDIKCVNGAKFTLKEVDKP